MKAIIADNLTKVFGHLVAVDHISFEVEEGRSLVSLALTEPARQAPS